MQVDQKLDKVLSYLASMQALQSSANLDTKQRLTHLQFSHIMTFISTGTLGDPARALQFNESIRRRARGRTFGSTNRFWESRNLADWSSANTCQIAILQGNYRARLAMREFCVEIISQLKSKNTSTWSWIFRYFPENLATTWITLRGLGPFARYSVRFPSGIHTSRPRCYF